MNENLIFKKSTCMKGSFCRDTGPKPKRQKLNVGFEVLEEEYEKELLSTLEPKRRAVLPIKTKMGVIPQTVVKHDKGKMFIAQFSLVNRELLQAFS